MRPSARSIRGCWAALSILSRRRRQSSEHRAPADGRPERARKHFKRPAAYPGSSNIARVMFARFGAGGARGRPRS
eukprot:8280713-Alexandrium_andersonii.AAC.1